MQIYADNVAFYFWAGKQFFFKGSLVCWCILWLLKIFAIVSLSSNASRLFVVNYKSSFITRKSSVANLMRWFSVSWFPYQSILLKCFILLKKIRHTLKLQVTEKICELNVEIGSYYLLINDSFHKQSFECEKPMKSMSYFVLS